MITKELVEKLIKTNYNSSDMTLITNYIYSSTTLTIPKLFRFSKNQITKKNLKNTLIIMFKKKLINLEMNEKSEIFELKINEQRILDILMKSKIFEFVRKMKGDIEAIIVSYIILNYCSTKGQIINEVNNFLTFEKKNQNYKKMIEKSFEKLLLSDFLVKEAFEEKNKENDEKKIYNYFILNSQKIYSLMRSEIIVEFFEKNYNETISQFAKIILQNSFLYNKASFISQTEFFQITEIKKKLILKNPEIFQTTNFENIITEIKKNCPEFFIIKNSENEISININKLIQNLQTIIVENHIKNLFSKNHLRVFKGISILNFKDEEDLAEKLLIKKNQLFSILNDLENIFLINKICRIGTNFAFSENLENFFQFYNNDLFKIVLNLFFVKDKIGFNKENGDIKLSKFEICLNILLKKILIINVF